MTVLTKPSLKKIPLIDDNRCAEEVIDIRPSPSDRSTKHYKGVILCTGVITALLLLMGAITAMQIYEQVSNDAQRHNRYQGFCSIPLPRDIQMLEQRKAPLRWRSVESGGHMEPEVQVVNLLDADPKPLLDMLSEELDIDIDESVEKISVMNNGHAVSFLHDFDTNTTGIVDADRCYAMELDGSLVLPPEVFVLGLQRGDEFDVSRVRSALRAVLRDALATTRSAALREQCIGKPIYPLERDETHNIRKRSVDEPPHDYIQFAGNRIQEIEISNLAELLEYEQKNKLLA